MLIDDFHEMEEEAKLFDIVDQNNIPIWDILRYNIFLKYYYIDECNTRIAIANKKNSKNYFAFIFCVVKFIYTLLFPKKKKFLVQTTSRYFKNKLYYDKSLHDLVDFLDSDYLALETHAKSKTAYDSIYDLTTFYRRIHRTPNLDKQIYQCVCNALLSKFDVCKVTYEELNIIYHNFLSDAYLYNILIKRLSPKNLLLSAGNPKAIIWIARKYDIKIDMWQHAVISNEDIGSSYPKFINNASNILFADRLFTYGPYWGEGVNIPVKQIIPIGNSHFSNQKITKTDLSAKKNKNVLIISTVVHGVSLAGFIGEYSKVHEDFDFIFKLHPNEFNMKDFYVDYFKINPNVKVVTSEVDTTDLLLDADLVVLIVSTILFEALDMNKKVAVYRKLNYKRNESLQPYPNLYFFELQEELDKILEYEVQKNAHSKKFYIPLDKNILPSVFSE